jgi:hypothetical protein
MRTRSTILCLVLAMAAGLALAQTTLYRSTMPDGKKVVSDRPMAGAVKVEELKPSPGNYAPGEPVKPAAKADPKAAPKPEPGKPGAFTPPPPSPASKAADREAAIAQARKAYDEALARQAKGKEEGEGDRTGTYKGGARLSDGYYKRQEALQAEVDAARRNLEAVQRQ